MRIVANRILTQSELENSRVEEEVLKTHIKRNLTNMIAEKLLTLDALYSERERGRDTEYLMEMVVLSKETFNDIILTLQENDVRKTVREKIRDILINSL